MIKDVMARLDGTKADDARLAAVAEIVEHFDGCVIGLFVNALPLLVPPDNDSVAIAETARLLEKARAAGDVVESSIRQQLARLQRPAELRRFDTVGDVLGQIVSREARTADAFVALRPDGSAQEPEQLIESVLFGAGRHLVLVPDHRAGSPAFDHVMIAWNGGREAARAVAEAMPYLRKAKQVSIAVVDEDLPVEDEAIRGKDLAEHLLHHGVAAAIHRVPADGSIGATLIAESRRLKPDLIVMGGYGHSRLREWLLGGATYEMVHNTPVPLLIAH